MKNSKIYFDEIVPDIDESIEQLTKEIANTDDDDKIIVLSIQRDNLRSRKNELYNEAHGV